MGCFLFEDECSVRRAVSPARQQRNILVRDHFLFLRRRREVNRMRCLQAAAGQVVDHHGLVTRNILESLLGSSSLFSPHRGRADQDVDQ
ncbi:hypothetical protein GJAV_G00262990 [Gymnothorax javanicus]|nr:hypothetical protein GJAV_G00262990 [Gymnothorax javanicus]